MMKTFWGKTALGINASSAMCRGLLPYAEGIDLRVREEFQSISIRMSILKCYREKYYK